MHTYTGEADKLAEHEREFERWLLATLEHGRAELRTPHFNSSARAGAQKTRRAFNDSLGSETDRDMTRGHSGK